jgi:predicted AlkP superfamily pyrophosphatase or phosphodiesterase
MNEKKKLLVVQVAGLGCNVVTGHGSEQWGDLKFRPMQSVFPAVTCAAQAAFRTGVSPDKAGMPGNGFYDRKLGKVMFWEQSSALVAGERIWEQFRVAGKTVAMLFWQQSLGETVDMVLSPAPIHKHHGGMIQDCYSQPEDLYGRICEEVGRGFNLKNYWGPMASVKSSQWIAEATAYIIGMSDAPDLCMTYLPGLDYDLQRYGVESEKSQAALKDVFGQLDLLKRAAEDNGYELLVFGDYAIVDIDKGPVYLNRVLRESGYMATREVDGMLYPDFHVSRAFAVVDHEVAHIYVKDEAEKGEVTALLCEVEGVESVKDGVAISKDGYWFAYPWWEDNKQAPEYAAHVDIHSKPGYDPCELFFGKVPWKVSVDADRVKGSHGKIGAGREVCWASTLWDGEVENLLGLSDRVRVFLGGRE